MVFKDDLQGQETLSGTSLEGSTSAKEKENLNLFCRYRLVQVWPPDDSQVTSSCVLH